MANAESMRAPGVSAARVSRRTGDPASGAIVEGLEPRVLLSSSFKSPVTSNLIGVNQFGATATDIGDFNGDGIPDLVAGYAGGNAQIFLGTATGTLTRSSVLSTGGIVGGT